MPFLLLGGRGVDEWNLVAVLQAGREPVSADVATVLEIILHAGAGETASRHKFNRLHRELLYHHRPRLQVGVVAKFFRQIRVDGCAGRNHMRPDAVRFEPGHPEVGDRQQHPAFVGHHGIEDEVEDADTVGDDDQ